MTDWQTVKLGDVAYEVSERVDNPSTSGYDRFVGLEHFVSGDFTITSWGTTENLISAMKLFKAGDTLFARRNAYLKRASMADFDGICSGDAIVLRNNEKMIDGFLPLILNTDHFWNYAIANAAGSMSKRVRVEDLMKYEFPLPPVDEQRRIADLLWAADDLIIRDEELITSLIVYKKSLFENLVEKELANGAKLVKFGELMLRSPDSGHSPISVDRETGHYVLILSAVSVNGYKRGHLKPIELTPEVKATKLQKGDFLISRSNTVELVGLVGIYNEDRNDISFPDTMMRLILDDSKIDRYFLEQYLLSRKARRKIQGFAAGTSGSMKKINRSHISALEIPLLPLEKQHSIMKIIRKCAEGISAAEDRRSKSYELKKQLMNKMLSG
jgi:restriction endonuclease S subunit